MYLWAEMWFISSLSACRFSSLSKPFLFYPLPLVCLMQQTGKRQFVVHSESLWDKKKKEKSKQKKNKKKTSGWDCEPKCNQHETLFPNWFQPKKKDWIDYRSIILQITFGIKVYLIFSILFGLPVIVCRFNHLDNRLFIKIWHSVRSNESHLLDHSWGNDKTSHSRCLINSATLK